MSCRRSLFLWQLAVRHIDSKLQEKISLETMATLCGMSQFQFSRAFKREHGVNFKEFLIRQRVGRACDLLRNPGATVADIAYAVGFAYPPYFARVFRRLVGVAPSAFRGNGTAAPGSYVAGSLSLLVLRLADLSIPFLC
jgi:AraC-like DNA-binding protein